MNTSELLNADHRVLAGLIGKVWSTDAREHADQVARENAELFIRMYMEENLQLHRSLGPGENEPVEDLP